MSFIKNFKKYILAQIINKNSNRHNGNQEHEEQESSRREDDQTAFFALNNTEKKQQLADKIIALKQLPLDTPKEELERRVEEACIIFKNIYIQSYYGILGKDLATLEFDRSEIASATRADYSPNENNVTFYMGNKGFSLSPQFHPHQTEMLSIEDFFKRGKIENFVLICFWIIAHEYQHNLQSRGSDALLPNNNIAKSLVEGITNKYAWQIVDQDQMQRRKGEKLDHLDVLSLAIIKNRDFSPQELYDINFALYFQSFCEQDARQTSLNFISLFIKDIEKFLPQSINQAFEEQSILFASENECQKSYYKKSFKAYEDMLQNISQEDYLNYCNIIEQEFYKEQADLNDNYETTLFSNKTGSIMLKGVERESYFHLLLLKSSFKFLLQSVSQDKAYIHDLNKDDFEKIKKFDLLLLKNGLDFAVMQLDDYLADQFTSAERSLYRADMLQDYYNMLKSEEITSKSLLFFDRLTYEQQSDIFCDFIRQGKTEFCKEIINPNKDSNLLLAPNFLIGPLYFNRLGKDDQYRDPFIYESEILDEIDTRLTTLQNRLVQDELLLDDINDMSSLLLTMCNQKGVLINGQINHINDGDAQNKEEKIKKRLYNLFIKAEELVYRQMMKSGNGHWFQYGQVDDRGKLLLHGKEADQRFRKLYGPIEYQKRRLNIDKSFKKDNNSENFSSDSQKAQDENDVNQF